MRYFKIGTEQYVFNKTKNCRLWDQQECVAGQTVPEIAAPSESACGGASMFNIAAERTQRTIRRIFVNILFLFRLFPTLRVLVKSEVFSYETGVLSLESTGWQCMAMALQFCKIFQSNCYHPHKMLL